MKNLGANETQSKLAKDATGVWIVPWPRIRHLVAPVYPVCLARDTCVEQRDGDSGICAVEPHPCGRSQTRSWPRD